MALGAAQQHALAVQLEGAVLDKLDLADAEALVEAGLPAGVVEGDPAAIEVRRLRRPKRGVATRKEANWRGRPGVIVGLRLWMERPAGSKTSTEWCRPGRDRLGCRGSP
jgi:hypothetical protein